MMSRCAGDSPNPASAASAPSRPSFCASSSSAALAEFGLSPEQREAIRAVIAYMRRTGGDRLVDNEVVEDQ